MYSVIGLAEKGEFASSVVALDYAVEPQSFVAFAAWTPHRYILSIEQNTVPGELAGTIREQLLGKIRLRDDSLLAERLFDHDYGHVVRGPNEGRLMNLPSGPVALEAAESDLVDLVACIPLIEAMAHPASLDRELRSSIELAAQRASDNRAVEKLLRHCVKTVDWTNEARSPGNELRKWFAGVWNSWHEAAPTARSAHIRDAERMTRAVVGTGQFWASGDWGEYLCDVVGLAVARLSGVRDSAE